MPQTAGIKKLSIRMVFSKLLSPVTQAHDFNPRIHIATGPQCTMVFKFSITKYLCLLHILR
jgi:hypothetical protein